MTKTKLDEYEQDIENNFSQQEQVVNSKQRIAQLKISAIKHQTNKKSITIRIADTDLEAMKIKASKQGLAYQTYINMIIHQEATKL